MVERIDVLDRLWLRSIARFSATEGGFFLLAVCSGDATGPGCCGLREGAGSGSVGATWALGTAGRISTVGRTAAAGLTSEAGVPTGGLWPESATTSVVTPTSDRTMPTGTARRNEDLAGGGAGSRNGTLTGGGRYDRLLESIGPTPVGECSVLPVLRFGNATSMGGSDSCMSSARRAARCHCRCSAGNHAFIIDARSWVLAPPEEKTQSSRAMRISSAS